MVDEKIQLGKSQATYERAKMLIPGGTQLLSKRPEMFLPDLWPAYYDKASGCEVWDLDGKKYVDAAYMGVGANLLGYCDEEVDNAVIDSIRKGTNTTLNAPEEVELAELMLDIHPWA
ncbi:MAG: aminotransferase class III-fold pyridoxal phosphate-dependent enzyme, partial [Flavobacteriales bacterium]|nr:aminotransferase class III-fold pyridoxal phosphate-dependent enzyme [Flavobacteriales bacterium]